MINAQAEVSTVLASSAKFEEHPESLRPRVFVKVDSGDNIVWYELLQDGFAIPWPKAPSGFDFWMVKASSISDINMVRA